MPAPDEMLFRHQRSTCGPRSLSGRHRRRRDATHRVRRASRPIRKSAACLPMRYSDRMSPPCETAMNRFSVGGKASAADVPLAHCKFSQLPSRALGFFFSFGPPLISDVVTDTGSLPGKLSSSPSSSCSSNVLRSSARPAVRRVKRPLVGAGDLEFFIVCWFALLLLRRNPARPKWFRRASTQWPAHSGACPANAQG